MPSLPRADRIAYYKDLVPSKNGGCARCKRLYANLATSDQQDEALGLDLPGPTSASRPSASPVPTAGLPAAKFYLQLSLPFAASERYAESRMKPLLRLALAADLVALMTVVLGSWTRINGAGLTCPDWPLCHGRLLPSLSDGTLWEWTHRLLASAVAPLVVALVAVAWRKRKRSPFIGPTLGVIVVLFVAQVFLGAETVRLANSPISVVLHWAYGDGADRRRSPPWPSLPPPANARRGARSDARGVGANASSSA